MSLDQNLDDKKKEKKKKKKDKKRKEKHIDTRTKCVTLQTRNRKQQNKKYI